MTIEFLVMMLFGHLVGDFLLQPKWMAVDKGKSFGICWLHCVVYTLTMACFTWPQMHGPNEWKWMCVVLIPHFIIDRWSLANVWLTFLGGRTFKDFFSLPKKTGERVVMLQGAFLAVVYTVVDSTLHLMCLYFGAKLFLK